MKIFYFYLCCWLCIVSFSAQAKTELAATESTATESLAKESGIVIQEIAEGVWTHTSYYHYPNGVQFPSNGLIVKEGESLILVDTAWGEIKTLQLLTQIKKQINLPVHHAVVTHAHSDRAAGVDVLEAQGIDVWAHPLTKTLTTEHGLPVPNKVFKGLEQSNSQVDFHNVKVLFLGAGHAMDNLIVWLPGQKILFGGCAVRATSAKSVGNVKHGDAHSWLKITDNMAKQFSHAKLVVPGHGEVGGTELLSHTQTLLHVYLNSHALNKRL